MSTPTLRDALRKRYPMPEWVLMEEVRDAAGFQSKRSADAIAMNTWPSRGLEINGFEIKASRSDWLRELKDPAKAEAIAAYCDRWWIVALPDLVKPDELPIGWGLLELKANGSLKEMKLAPKKEDVKPLNRTFIAAMMRRCGQIDEQRVQATLEDQKKAIEKYWREFANNEATRRARRYEEQKAMIDKLEQATGIEIAGLQYRTDAFISAVKFALAAYDIHGQYSGLQSIKGSMERCIKQINDLGALVPPADQIDKEAA